jgi:hypothetical protein
MSKKPQDALTVLQSFNPEKQKQAQEQLSIAIKAHTETVIAKNNELIELKKIKLDPTIVKYLVNEFNVQQADVELLLRKNNNDISIVIDKLVNTTQY